MSKICAKCEKPVYPTEELKCLDKVSSGSGSGSGKLFNWDITPMGLIAFSKFTEAMSKLRNTGRFGDVTDVSPPKRRQVKRATG